MKSFLGAALVSLLLMTSAHAGNTEESEWQKIYAEAEKQFLQGKYGPSLDKAREAQAIAEKAYGTDSQQTAMSLSMICVVLQTTGKMSEAEAVINVGVSGPGVINHAVRHAPRDMPLHELADLIKKLSFKLIGKS